jgi:hypothetical protein
MRICQAHKTCPRNKTCPHAKPHDPTTQAVLARIAEDEDYETIVKMDADCFSWECKSKSSGIGICQEIEDK